jgi:hypothetical protein
MSLPLNGITQVQRAVAAGINVPPNAYCWTPITVNGPMNSADPADNIFVGGGRTIGAGQLGDGAYLSLYTAQGVTTALGLAGAPASTAISISKRPDSITAGGLVVADPYTQTASGAIANQFHASKYGPYQNIMTVGSQYITQPKPSVEATTVVKTSNGVTLAGKSQFATVTTEQPSMSLSQVASASGSGPISVNGMVFYPGGTSLAADAAGAAFAPDMYGSDYGAFSRKGQIPYSCGTCLGGW